jgi:prolyl oligopeptidase
VKGPIGAVAVVAMALVGWAGGAVAEEDPFLWLEDVQGEKALAWAKQHNAATTKVLEAVPEYAPTFARTLQILDSKEKIPSPRLHGSTVYNFWKDEQHPRGVWRRTPLASYRTAAPVWETVLDIDALDKTEGVLWVFGGATCLAPGYERCMIALSRGGSDASTYREFDAVAKQFVAGGFALAEAKSEVSWYDRDTLWVGTDLGPGSLTTSGYPRIVKLWKRGTPLAEARTVFECGGGDVGAWGTTEVYPDGRYDLVTRAPAAFRQESFLMLGGRLVKLDVPEDAQPRAFFRDQALFSLRSDWTVGGTTYRSGSLLAIALDDLLRGSRRFAVLFEPAERVSLAGVGRTRDRVLVETLDNVSSRLASFTRADGGWKREAVPLPGLGTAGVTAASDEEDTYFLSYQNFFTPASVWLVENGGRPERAKSMPEFFDSTGMKVEQLEATSKDGTKIPYFVVTPKGFVADGAAPALLYGYGGFEVSEVPTYSATMGSAWLARGGVYVLANIRGGGEFGPAWHQAAMREHHIRNFEDFVAVGEDVVARKITSSRHLGIMGGSQGGLLVGGTFALRPGLFRAVVAQVPLADMRRYSHLLAGASWMAEYGDPDKPEDWAFMQAWSPYQLLRADVKYPTPFYWTNTRDDRVHPAHARKMVARLEALGHPVYYFENTEGGHGSGAVNTQTATITALQYAYLWMMLR